MLPPRYVAQYGLAHRFSIINQKHINYYLLKILLFFNRLYLYKMNIK